MNETQALTQAEQQKQLVQKLVESFDQQTQKEIARDIFVVMQLKTTTDSNYQKRKFNVYEAFSYVCSCRELGMSVHQNHMIVLEGQNYITLDGHLQNAQNNPDFCGISTKMVEKDIAKRSFRVECTIKKRVHGNIIEFSAEGVASPDTIKKKTVTTLFIEQMAEARAMRRCLRRAFPVGYPHYEDREIWNTTVESETSSVVENTDALVDDYIISLKNSSTVEELEEIKKNFNKNNFNLSKEQKEMIVEVLNNQEKKIFFETQNSNNIF